MEDSQINKVNETKMNKNYLLILRNKINLSY